MSEAAFDVEAVETRQPVADQFGMSPLQLLRALKRGWPLILICGLLLGTAGYVYTVTSVPKRFTTSATISVQQPQVAIPALQGALSGDTMADPMPLVRSEVQILTSRALIQKVARQLHLEEDPEFNAALRPPTTTEQFKRYLSDQLPAAISDPLISAGLLPDTSQQSTPIPESVIQENVVGSVASHLSIFNDNRSLIITIEFTALRPDLAAKVVNTLLAQYEQDRVLGREAANANANSELSQRVKSIRAEIDGLEAKITAVREKYNLVQTRAGSVGQQQLEDLSAALTRASSDRAQAVASYQRAAVLAKTGQVPSDNAAVISSSTIGTLRDREATAQRRVAELSTTHGPDHPQLISAQAELVSIRAALASEAQRVMASLRAQADVATAREAEAQRQLNEAQGSAAGLASVRSELTQLEKDAESRRAIYQTLLQGEAQTASKTTGTSETGVRVVSPAVAPAYPSGPRPKIAGVFGMLSGCALGGLLVLARNTRDRGFMTPDEVAQDVGVMPLAVVTRRAGRKSLAGRVVAEPNGPEAEALRSLRNRLRFQGRAASPRSILFVSAAAREDSAGIAAAFARVAAMDGLRVLLLEADLRAPSLAKHLDVPVRSGLVDALQQGQLWQEHVGRDGPTSLETLLVADPPSNAAQLLDSMQLRNLVADTRNDYNLIVATAQPIAADAQTIVVASLVDTTILVVGAKQARRQVVRHAVQTLSASKKKRPVLVFTS